MFLNCNVPSCGVEYDKNMTFARYYWFVRGLPFELDITMCRSNFIIYQFLKRFRVADGDATKGLWYQVYAVNEEGNVYDPGVGPLVDGSCILCYPSFFKWQFSVSTLI